MKNLLTITLVLLAFISYGQDTTYYDSNSKRIKSLEQATYYEIIHKSATDTNQVTTKTFFQTGNRRSECFENKTAITYKEWYENGQLHRVDSTSKDKLKGEGIIYWENGKFHKISTTSKGKLNGQVLTYWQDGTIKRNDTYKNDTLIKGSCYDREGKEIKHFDYEIMPSFPGGENSMMRYLATTTQYPMQCAEAGIQGTIYIHFIINKEGRVSDVNAVIKVHPELDAEAIRVAKRMPKWIPGTVDGEPVAVPFTMPVKFVLQ